MFSQQLRNHRGRGLVKRTASRNAQHGRISPPLRPKRLTLDDSESRDSFVHGFHRGGGLGVVRG
ncbi:MAG TPA: hypothetical protein VIQ50_07900, partial [Xanthobacteraceae bacterium]